MSEERRIRASKVPGMREEAEHQDPLLPFSRPVTFPQRTLHSSSNPHRLKHFSPHFFTRFLCCVKLTLNTFVCFAVVNLFLLLFFRGPSRQLGRVEEKSIFPLLQLQINIHLESALSLAGVEDRFSPKQETNT